MLLPLSKTSLGLSKIEKVFADRSFLISDLNITINHNERILDIGEVSLYEYEPETQCSSVYATSCCDNANGSFHNTEFEILARTFYFSFISTKFHWVRRWL